MTNRSTIGRRGRVHPTGNVRITMYNVGFGDCFLLSFSYSDGKDRHVLIDCGTSTERKERMAKVARKISEDCNGHLHGLVITHRHKDHLSAFGLRDVGGTLDRLRPDVVVQPWTEHPNAAAQATTAPSIFTTAALARLQSLMAAQQFAQQLARYPSRSLAGASLAMQKRLTFIASLSIPNKPAIDRLERISRRHAYVHTGSRSGLERVLPGVRVSVLGPPTLAQSANIRRQTRWDEAEFWQFQARLAKAIKLNRSQVPGSSALFPKATTASALTAPSHIKWVINRLDRAQALNVQRIVRALDNALNNTSVILLFQVSNKALLFSGDAQLENWQYALQKTEIRTRLGRTNLYKVGHHGSTNATPKSLWALFRNRNPRPRPGRLVTLLSTKQGKHENVPRESLVTALQRETNLESTEEWVGRDRLSHTYVL